MSYEKNCSLCHLALPVKKKKKKMSRKTAAKEMNNVEGSGTVSKHMAQNRFRRFKEGDTSLEDKSKSECGNTLLPEHVFPAARSSDPFSCVGFFSKLG